MPLRFYRKVHVLPGVAINLSRSGPSVSLGVRGAHVTFGRSGVTRTVGLPGTGIYYTSKTGHHTGVHSGLGSDGSNVSPILLGLLVVLVVLAILSAMQH